MSQCNTCKYKRDTFIFQLCTHANSEYISNEKSEFHTRIHMIKVQNGQCKIADLGAANAKIAYSLMKALEVGK